MRTLLQGPFVSLSTLIAAISGTFFLMNDEKLSGCYNLLIKTPLKLCGTGGVQCAMPFLFIVGLNAVFDLFTFVSLLRGVKVPAIALLALSIGISVVLQGIAAFITYKAIKPLMEQSPGLQETNQPPSQYVSLDTSSRGGPVLFTGQSHRLSA